MKKSFYKFVTIQATRQNPKVKNRAVIVTLKQKKTGAEVQRSRLKSKEQGVGRKQLQGNRGKDKNSLVREAGFRVQGYTESRGTGKIIIQREQAKVTSKKSYKA